MRKGSSRVDIALFLPSMEGGGTRRVMINLATGFLAHGHSVDIVLAKAEGRFMDQVPAGVRVVDLRASRTRASLIPLMRYMRTQKPKVLLSTIDYTNILALFAQRLTRVDTRIVLRQSTAGSLTVVQGNPVMYRLRNGIMRLTYPWANEIIAASSQIGAELSKWPGLSKVRVIPNPVNIARIIELAAEPVQHRWFHDQAPVIIAVGRLTPAKDYPALLRAFTELRGRKEAKLIILGDGELKPELINQIESLGISNDVDLLGFVDNPYSYMARAKLFVLSSRWEGMPNVIIESLAVGTQVVATDCESGPREILESGKYGSLVPVGDIAGLAAAMETALESSPDKGLLRGRALEYDLETITKRYLNVVMAETPARP